MKLFLFVFVLLSSSASYSFADLRRELFERARSGQNSLGYDQARVKMFNEIYLEKDIEGYFVVDVYCDQKMYLYRGTQVPGTRLPGGMNTEHTWPQSKFSSAHAKSVQKSDLHHLYPTLNKINSERGNLPFADVAEIRDLSCSDSQLGKNLKTHDGTYFEPPDEHKGNVARSMFYFSIRYQVEIDPVQEYFLRQWHILDPVDAEEKARHEIIFKYQRNRNPFIDEPALVNQILDF